MRTPSVTAPAHFDRNGDHYFHAGRAFLSCDRVAEARRAFEHALEKSPGNATFLSFAGLALVRQGSRDGLSMCKKATRLEAPRAEVYRNLGLAYLICEDKRRARQAFRQGLALDREDEGLLDAIDRMGMRQKPVFAFLPRSHSLNKYTGLLLYRLGVRGPLVEGGGEPRRGHRGHERRA